MKERKGRKERREKADGLYRGESIAGKNQKRSAWPWHYMPFCVALERCEGMAA
jgi:hypothetical protein